MPSIASRFIRKPRKQHYCAYCDHAITGPHLAFYGMAERGDKPYWIRVHVWSAVMGVGCVR